MRILLVTETLYAAGAETFVVRLANALVKYNDVAIINLHPEWSKSDLMSNVHNRIVFINVKFPFKKWIVRIDGLFFRLKIDFGILQHIFGYKLSRHISSFAPDIVHSHLFKSDYYVAFVKNKKFSHISTNHGDYLLYEDRGPVRFLNYKSKLDLTLKSLDSMVVISETQLNWLKQKMVSGHYGLFYSKIFNGYDITKDLLNQAGIPSISHLKIENEEFVFGMVARGIKEKGWESAINAFKLLNIHKKKLILIGDGPELDRLKRIHKNDNSIMFTGYKSNPLQYIRMFDVGLLPSYYQAESLPTVLIEYLLCKKPIITTDIGEVKNMLTSADGNLAGLFVNFSSAGVDEDDLFDKMSQLYKNSDLRERLAELSDSALRKFDMIECVNKYLSVYEMSLSINATDGKV